MAPLKWYFRPICTDKRWLLIGLDLIFRMTNNFNTFPRGFDNIISNVRLVHLTIKKMCEAMTQITISVKK